MSRSAGSVLAWLPRRSPGLFPTPGSVYRPAVPCHVKCQVHPSMTSCLFRVPSSRLPLVPFPARARLPGLSCLIAATPPSIHHRRDRQFPTSFRPQAFPASRRFAPLGGSWACFIPQTTSRLLPFRGFSLHAAVPSSSEGRAPLPLKRRPLPARRRSHFRRLPTSRLCSTRRSVRPGRGLAFPFAAPLVGLRPPPGRRSGLTPRFPGAIRS